MSCAAAAAEPKIDSVGANEGGTDGVRVESVNLPGSKMRFHVAVNGTSVQRAVKETLNGLEKHVNVPGFRPGKPVNEKILMNFIGKEKVLEQAAETVLLRHMKEALQEVEGKAIKDTEAVVTPRDHLMRMMSDCYNSDDGAGGTSLEFEVEVEVAPEVSWTGDYNKMSIDVTIPCLSAEGGDEASSPNEGEARRRTNLIISNRLKELGVMRIVADRGVEKGDVAVVSTEGFRIDEEGKKGDEILAARQERFRIDTNEDLSSYIPGFIEHLMYMKVGETKKDIRLTFPDNWVVEALRGTDSFWNMTVDELFCTEVPEESDEMADRIQPGMKSMSELREHLDGIAMEKIMKEEQDMVDGALLRTLNGLLETEVPEALVQEHGQQMYLQKLIQMQGTGQISSEQIAKLATREMVDNFIDSKRDEIVQSVRTTLAVEDVFNKENMEITREELEEEMKAAKLDFESNGMDYDEARLEEQAEEVLIGRKVMAHLREKSVVNKSYSFDQPAGKEDEKGGAQQKGKAKSKKKTDGDKKKKKKKSESA